MRFWIALLIAFLFSCSVLAKDVAVEPNYIYEQILNANNYNIVPYNYPAGSRELNIFGLRNMGQYNLNAVAAPDYTHLVYSEVYSYPDVRVTASAIYLIPLDSGLSKREAMISVSTKDKTGEPLIETDYPNLYPFKFNTFTPVDWNKTSDKIIIKEKLGQNYDQIYLTKLFLYDMTTGKLVDLNLVRTEIVNYWASKDLYLIDYKWDIKPLGFLAADETKIAVNAYGYYKKELKFLGTWIVDIDGTVAQLHSLTAGNEPNISSNGTCLKFIPDMGDIYKKQRKIDGKSKQKRYIEPL